MQQHEEVFLRVLRSALWGHPVQIPDGFNDWGAVMKLANMQAVNGLVWDVMVTNQKIKSSIPEQAVAAMRDIPKNNLSMHTKLNNALILVVTTLRKHGIEPVLLKGQGLAKYYPTPELRQCGDIDLYVSENNYEKTYETLMPIVSSIEEKSDIWCDVKHFNCSIGNVLIEVHRFSDVNILPKLNDIYQSYAQEGLNHNLVPLEFGGTVVMTPADQFNVYFIFDHLWRHFLYTGVGLRQLCDLAVFLNSHLIDQEYLGPLLTEMKDMKPWQIFGCVLVDYLGLSENKFPFYDSRNRRKAKRLLNMILEEGNFGQYGSYPRPVKYGYLREKLISLRCHVVRRANMVMIFPYHTMLFFSREIKLGISQVLKDLTSKLRR